MSLSPAAAKLARQLDSNGQSELASMLVKCGRKRRYPTLLAAFADAVRLAPKDLRFKMQVYPCQCGGFHLAQKYSVNKPLPPPEKRPSPGWVSPKNHTQVLVQRDGALREVARLNQRIAYLEQPWWIRLMHKCEWRKP